MKKLSIALSLMLFFTEMNAQKIRMDITDTTYFMNHIKMSAVNLLTNKNLEMLNGINYYKGNYFNIFLSFKEKDSTHYSISKGLGLCFFFENGDSSKLNIDEQVSNQIFKHNESNLFLQFYVDSTSLNKLSKKLSKNE
jgi:hypothetical protein